MTRNRSISNVFIHNSSLNETFLTHSLLIKVQLISEINDLKCVHLLWLFESCDLGAINSFGNIQIKVWP